MSWRAISRAISGAGRRSFLQGRESVSRVCVSNFLSGTTREEDKHVVSETQTMQARCFHTTAKKESTMILVGGVSLALGFVGLHYASEGIRAIKEKREKGEPIFARSK